MLEHLTYEETEKALMRWYEVLKDDGILRLAVPDIERVCAHYMYYKDLEVLIKRQATLNLLSFFAVDNMDFGKSFEKVELERNLFQIPEIRFAVVENLPRSVSVDFNEIIQLNNFSFDIVYL